MSYNLIVSCRRSARRCRVLACTAFFSVSAHPASHYYHDQLPVTQLPFPFGKGPGVRSFTTAGRVARRRYPKGAGQLNPMGRVAVGQLNPMGRVEPQLNTYLKREDSNLSRTRHHYSYFGYATTPQATSGDRREFRSFAPVLR